MKDGIRIDMTGKVFGRLTVESYAGKTKNQDSLWNCRCECGTLCVRTNSHLKEPKTPSCGCYNIDQGRKHLTKHGWSGHRFYHAWRAMMSRCYNPNNDAYYRYGGRGIAVDQPWHDFEAYLRDIEPSYPGEGHSVDRTDNEKNYGPTNFRWATSKVQSNNRRDNKRYEFCGRMMTVSEIGDETGVNPDSLRAAICRYGKSPEEAVRRLLLRKKNESAVQSLS